jgi:hypothetical protein
VACKNKVSGEITAVTFKGSGYFPEVYVSMSELKRTSVII